jgi:hypothetical protein
MVPAGILLPHRPLRRPAPAVVAQEPSPPPAPTALADARRCRRPRRKSDVTGSPERICAQEPRAAGRDLGLFPGGLRAAFPAARRRLGLSAVGGQVCPGRDCRVAEEDPSAFGHLPDRWRVSSGRRAQGERRMPGLDQLHAPERNDRAPLRHRTHLQRFRRSGARHNPEEMPAVAGTALNWRCAAIPT